MQQSPPKSSISFNYLTNSSKDDEDLLKQLTKGYQQHHDPESFYQQSNLSFKPFNYYEPSKQTTRQYFYDEMLKEISQARQLKLTLRDQYQQLQQQLTKKYLGNLIDELKELSMQNDFLRSQHYQCSKSRKRKPSFYNETPKSRKSIPLIITNPNTKIEKNLSPSNSKISKSPGLRKFGHSKATSTIFESKDYQQNKLKQISMFNNISTNYDKTNFLKLTHKRSQSRLLEITDKKENYSPISQKNYYPELQQSMIFDSSQSMIKQSSQASFNKRFTTNNLFLELLAAIAQQEKIKENQFMEQLNMNLNYQMNESSLCTKGHQKKYFIEHLEKQIQTVQTRIKELSHLVRQFQQQITHVNQSYTQANQLTQILLNIKGQTIKKQQHSQRLASLKQELKQKQAQLKKLSVKKCINSGLPPSLKTFMMLMGVQCSNQIVKTYQQLHQIIKNPQKFRLNNRKQQSKIVEISKSIDEGRKKFNQICKIYEARIKTVKQKIRRREKQTASVNK